MSIRIGTSGWAYDDWRTIFYPPELPQREWLGYYARRFDTVEINNSFYRLPTVQAFSTWREHAPLGFVYAVKASRFLTHIKKLKDPDPGLQLFFERACHLGNALGPILYQLPPSLHLDLPRLETFLAALPTKYRHVVEFRDPSWLVEEVFQLLERYHVSHCLHDLPPLKVPLRVTASPVYVRFHGNPLYRGDYRLPALKQWAKHIAGWHGNGLDVFVYFNNSIGGRALKNAETLQNLLT